MGKKNKKKEKEDDDVSLLVIFFKLCKLAAIFGASMGAAIFVDNTVTLMTNSKFYESLPYTVTKVCDREYVSPKTPDSLGKGDFYISTDKKLEIKQEKYKFKAGSSSYAYLGNEKECSNGPYEMGSDGKEYHSRWWCRDYYGCVEGVQEWMTDQGYSGTTVYLTGRFPPDCQDYGDRSCGTHRETGSISSKEYRERFQDPQAGLETRAAWVAAYPVPCNTEDGYYRCIPNLDPPERGGREGSAWDGKWTLYLWGGFFLLFWIVWNLIGRFLKNKVFLMDES